MANQAAVAAAPTKIQMMSNERHFFSSSDDNAMMRQIQSTHAPDGREFDVRPLLHIIQNILRRTGPNFEAITPPPPPLHLLILPFLLFLSATRLIFESIQGALKSHIDPFEEKAVDPDYSNILEILAYTINKISCEITCKHTGSGDVHRSTLAIFSSLSCYSWDAKVVLAMAAFAVTYGEFWLVTQLRHRDPLAKSVALIKHLPETMEWVEVLKMKYEALNSLIKAMIDVAKCIIEFRELPSHYISKDTTEMVTATTHIPTAVYWTIRSIVACSYQIADLIGVGHEFIASTAESWELSSLAHKVSNINNHLRKQLTVCYQIIDEKRQLEAYQNLVRLLDGIHSDNIKVLKPLIYNKDDQPALVDAVSKQALLPRKKVNVDVLRRRNVLLLISDMDISQEDLTILREMYSESRQQPSRAESQYEVVWLPVMERGKAWTEEKEKRFETLGTSMPWYYISHPSLMEPEVLKYIKDVWHFVKKPLLVVLDPHGRVVNPNALHMMWIWGSLAFPFTSTREEELWKEETWRLELLVDGIEPALFNWITEGKCICLYGGEDMEWIRSFTTGLEGITKEVGVVVEMLYVGKNNPREKVRKNNEAIAGEGLSHVLDLLRIRFFWVRLESMWHSKMQHGKTVTNDGIMQEIMTMLSFDSSDEGWAVMGMGKETAKGKGDLMLQSIDEFEEWRDGAVKEKGFLIAMNSYLQGLHTPHHCNRLILPGTSGSIPESVVCAECGRAMEKFIMYRCCTD